MVVNVDTPDVFINGAGEQEWRGVAPTTPFTRGLFHTVAMNNDPECTYDHSRQWAFHSELGSITVLDRRTGFGYRDTETGYRDPEGLFWLASGMQDVRDCGCATVGEAIEWVKARANACKGV